MRCLRVSVQAGLTPDRLGPRPDRSSAALGCGPRRADGELAQTAPTRSGKELAMSVIKKNNKNNRTNPKRVNFRGQKKGSCDIFAHKLFRCRKKPFGAHRFAHKVYMKA